MKKVALLILMLAAMSQAYGYWYLKDCHYGQYKMGYNSYWGNVGIYEQNGEYITMFFGGNWCPQSIQ